MYLCVAIFKGLVTMDSVLLCMCLLYNKTRSKECVATFITLFVVSL